MIELPPEIHGWFVESGCTPNVAQPVPDFVPADHPAHAILSAFSGIALLERDCTKDDRPPIEELKFCPFPSTPRHIRKWSARLRSPLVGIADECNCHAEIYVDKKGRCFSNSLIHNCFSFAGETLTDTLEGILHSRRMRPLLPPMQPSVSMYGETIKRGDPRIWDWKTNR